MGGRIHFISKNIRSNFLIGKKRPFWPEKGIRYTSATNKKEREVLCIDERTNDVTL